jgi:hypothetical protein
MSNVWKVLNTLVGVNLHSIIQEKVNDIPLSHELKILLEERLIREK